MTTRNHIARRGVRPAGSAAATQSLLFVGDNAGCIARVAVALQAALDRFIPSGYEDESGFHYGPTPVSERSN